MTEFQQRLSAWWQKACLPFMTNLHQSLNINNRTTKPIRKIFKALVEGRNFRKFTEVKLWVFWQIIPLFPERDVEKSERIEDKFRGISRLNKLPNSERTVSSDSPGAVGISQPGVQGNGWNIRGFHTDDVASKFWRDAQEFRFSHRSCGVKLLTWGQEQTEALFWRYPFGIMFKLMPTHQNFDTHVQNSLLPNLCENPWRTGPFSLYSPLGVMSKLTPMHHKFWHKHQQICLCKNPYCGILLNLVCTR